VLQEIPKNVEKTFFLLQIGKKLLKKPGKKIGRELAKN
jgi:hypothetical protein